MNKMDINGQFTSGKSIESLQIIYPATEEVLDEGPNGVVEDYLAAVAEFVIKKGIRSR
ncbi:MAG: hypothetical protein QGM50_06105 [Anaerolineae bacterium]|nr:hypothetical protein [Anaerolineae bacterium]MDK1081210.1 hypothetical protein [Anaerolineae bacterium]MDK1118351.1 hypothetical protein [Anaerolineae bacterium]